ncbi:MAG: hypothetical protein KF809_05535 [Chloroflexi bacterium]|nr:hypothetical protein [Chloroflexota bacterium]
MRHIPFLRRRSRGTLPIDQTPSRRRRAEGGQALVVFVLLSVVLVGAVAIVTDVSWLWYGNQRMQRAADAAALAGAIYLPGNTAQAYASARAEATKNGFTSGVDGVSVTPMQDPLNRRRLIVTINGPVGAFFARALGFTEFGSQAVSRAEYVLPVPMGSPENYYGIGYYVGSSSSTRNQVDQTNANSNWRSATTFTPNQTNNNNDNWANPGRVTTDDNQFATSAAAATSAQVFRDFGLLTGGSPPIPALAGNQTMEIRGIEVELRALYGGSGGSSNCQIRTELSWNGGTNWSTAVTNNLGSSEATITQGSATSTSAWGGRTWDRADFTDVRVRLTFVRGSGCGTARFAQIDRLRLRVSYRITTTTQVTDYNLDGRQDIRGPNNETLRQQNFWGSMQSQGAPSAQGDAFMTYYNQRTGTTNASYDPGQYYQYGVDIPAGATNGRIWVYDPGFCDVTTAAGVGENWTVGGTNGNSTPQPVSSYFDVYDTRNTPYELADDVLVASFGNTFRRHFYQDVVARTAAGGANLSGSPADCRDATWHDRWVLLASGLTGGGTGRTYRIHTHSTDPTSSSDQLSTTALNNFAFFASASGGTPKVYGIGAMEAYFRLPQNQTSDFYMAQIEEVHAGKTMVIELWDPGDTGNLSATLQILRPAANDYVPAQFSYAAEANSLNASNCNSLAGTNVTSVVTNTGGSSRFNGCWLTITIPLPTNYDAPLPSSDNIATEGGWWKMRYIMGSGSGNATDLTTWKVSIRGNPVHLVLP